MLPGPTHGLVCASVDSGGSSAASSRPRICYPDDVRAVGQQRYFLPTIFADAPEDRATTSRRRRRRHRGPHQREQQSDSPVPTEAPAPAPPPPPPPAPPPPPPPPPPPVAAAAPAPVSAPQCALLPHGYPPAAAVDDRATAEAAHAVSPDAVQFGVASALASGSRRGAGGWQMARLIRLVSRLRRGGERRASSTALERRTAAGTLGDKGAGEDPFLSLRKGLARGADETSTNATGDLYEASSNSEQSASVPLQHQRRRGQACA